jgi:hypothetical protein
MPVFFSDPSPTAYAFGVILVAVLVGVYLRSRRKKDLYPLAGGVAALLALFLIDRFVESPREESMRRMHEMSAASAKKNWDDVFTNVSDSFSYKGAGGAQTDKKGLREKVRSVESFVDKGFVVWGFSRDDFKQINDTTVEIGFSAKVKDNDATTTYVKATFTKDPDGQWRMSGFTCYEPINTKERRTLPGLDSAN